MKPNKIPILSDTLLAALAGAAIMAAELLSARALAPALGSGIETWAGVIGATLAWGGAGAMLAPKLAERTRREAAALWLSGAAVSLIWAAWITTNIPGALPGGAGVAAIAASITVGPAALCLGALVPTTTARATKRCGDPDRAASRTSAAATAGSVIGTLATPLIILPHLATNTSLAGLGLVCGLIGTVLSPSPKTVAAMLAAALAVGTLEKEQATQYRVLGQTITSRESPYQRVTVKKNQQGQKAMVLNNQVAGSQDPRLQYMGFLDAAGLESGKPAKSLYLGGGAFIVPNEQIRQRPEDDITVAEIDPVVVDTAQEYFGVDPKIKVITTDARQCLKSQENGSLDLIFCDTYLDATDIPPHLSSAEFFGLIAKKLKPGGVVVVNAIGAKNPAPGTPSRIALLNAAMGAALPNTDVHSLDRGDDNLRRTHILRGSKSKLPTIPKTAEAGTIHKVELEPSPKTPIDMYNPTEFAD